MAARDARTLDRTPSGRDRILEAAYDLFSRAGVRAVGVDTITAEADVAKLKASPRQGDQQAAARVEARVKDLLEWLKGK